MHQKDPKLSNSTLQGINISPWTVNFEDDVPNFPRWDMWIPWRVLPFCWGIFTTKNLSQIIGDDLYISPSWFNLSGKFWTSRLPSQMLHVGNICIYTFTVVKMWPFLPRNHVGKFIHTWSIWASLTSSQRHGTEWSARPSGKRSSRPSSLATSSGVQGRGFGWEWLPDKHS